ncbi:MAG: glycosyltransferase family 1 protein [Myxococcales bacterium]|nr:glycosyltransferase family 1 protein [Myxococcales bacterium]
MGGQERVALDLARRQRQDGCAVMAVSLAPPPDGPMAHEFSVADVRIRTIPKGRGFDAGLPLRLAWLLLQNRIEIVHTHNPQPLIYGAPAARLAGARVVHTKHGANPEGGRRLALRRLAGRLADAFVAVSPITADVARSNREISELKLHVVPNGIDLDRFHPDEEARAEVRDALGIPQGAFVVGTVGRLSSEKDQSLLLRAMGPLLGERLRLVIVGDGPEEDALRRRAAALTEGRFVHFLGARRDVPRILAAFDLFALSSLSEGLPLVIPEAMASGLPVVSTAVGGIPTVLDEGVTGFLVPPGDERALRERLRDLAARPDLGAACGAQARRVALDRYSDVRMARDYLAIYRRTLVR